MIVNPKDGDCATCGERIYFPQGGGMMPPLLGNYFVCEACFASYRDGGWSAVVQRAKEHGVEVTIKPTVGPK